jgi:hypothetical protein
LLAFASQLEGTSPSLQTVIQNKDDMDMADLYRLLLGLSLDEEALPTLPNAPQPYTLEMFPESQQSSQTDKGDPHQAKDGMSSDARSLTRKASGQTTSLMRVPQPMYDADRGVAVLNTMLQLTGDRIYRVLGGLSHHQFETCELPMTVPVPLKARIPLDLLNFIIRILNKESNNREHFKLFQVFQPGQDSETVGNTRGLTELVNCLLKSRRSLMTGIGCGSLVV